MCDATLTYRTVAERFNVSVNTVRSRARRGKWQAERTARANLLQQSATQKSVSLAAAELVEFNRTDLLLAKALRAQAAKSLRAAGDKIAAKDLGQLAGAVESAQRVARLALGASTENSQTQPTMGLTDPLLDEFNLEQMPDDELQALRQLVNKVRGSGRIQ